MRLDDLLPHWHHRERHHVAVRAPSAAVLAAAQEVTAREVPLFRGLLRLGSLRGGDRMTPDRPFLAQMTAAGFTVLDRTDDEIVIGAIPSTGEGGGAASLDGDDPATAFREFQRSGHYKVAFNFRCADGLLTTETRVLATDEASRRRFLRYWMVIRVPSGLIRRDWLRAIKRRAQDSHTRGPVNDTDASED